MTNQSFDSSTVRKTAQIILMFILLAVIIAPSGVVRAEYAERTSLAATSCQCVVYIKNKYGLSGSAGAAKDMGVFLKNRGFWKLTVPRPGEIIIMKPAFEHGVSSTYGHVAIIHAVVDMGTSWKITVRGANQSGSKWTESNCTNVSF